MEDDQEFEEKVNLIDFLFPDSLEEKYVLYGENLQGSSSASQLTTLSPVSSGSIEKTHSDIENLYGLKEMKIVLNRLILPINGIKQEEKEEESNYHEAFQEDNSWNKRDLRELKILGEILPSIGIKEEPLTKEESDCDETFQEHYSEDCGSHETNVQQQCDGSLKEDHSDNKSKKGKFQDEVPPKKVKLQNGNSSAQKRNTHHLPYQCHSCNYVFGVKSSFVDHMKNCKESDIVCRTILESLIDVAVTERRWKVRARPRVHRTPSASYQFVCCGEYFTKFAEFNLHKFTKHGIEFLVCGLCKRQEKHSRYLHQHYRGFHFPGINVLKTKNNLKNEELTIPKSTTVFSAQTGESTNLMEESSSNENECTALQHGILCQCHDCNRITSDTSRGETNMSVCKPYACKLCNLRFCYKARLNSHMKTHIGLKKFPCNICVKSFTNHLTLKHHMLTHHSADASPFKVKCDICFKELSCKSSLTKHVRNIHLRQKKLRSCCPHCPKTLADSKSLARHLKQHIQETEYICAHCSQVFYLKDNLTYHIKTQHLPQEPVTCEICGHIASNKLRLYHHKAKKHGDKRFSCEICGKLFKLKSTLEVHQVIHFDERPFTCETCGKTFKRDSNLLQHKYTHSSDRPHTCDICGQSFRMRTHVKQHMAVHGLLIKTHKCSFCKKLFAKKKDLNLHMSGHDVHSI